MSGGESLVPDDISGIKNLVGHDHRAGMQGFIGGGHASSLIRSSQTPDLETYIHTLPTRFRLGFQECHVNPYERRKILCSGLINRGAASSEEKTKHLNIN